MMSGIRALPLLAGLLFSQIGLAADGYASMRFLEALREAKLP